MFGLWSLKCGCAVSSLLRGSGSVPVAVYSVLGTCFRFQYASGSDVYQAPVCIRCLCVCQALAGEQWEACKDSGYHVEHGMFQHHPSLTSWCDWHENILQVRKAGTTRKRSLLPAGVLNTTQSPFLLLSSVSDLHRVLAVESATVCQFTVRSLGV